MKRHEAWHDLRENMVEIVGKKETQLEKDFVARLVSIHAANLKVDEINILCDLIEFAYRIARERKIKWQEE